MSLPRGLEAQIKGKPSTSSQLVGGTGGGSGGGGGIIPVPVNTDPLISLLLVDGSTGLKTITLTGDVTGSGTSSIATTIANNAVTTVKIADGNVTLAKIQNIASQSLLGRTTTASGVVEQLGVDASLLLTIGSGNLSRAALTGDVTASAGSNVTTIANNAVTTAKILDANITYAKLQNETDKTLIGRASGSTGVPGEIGISDSSGLLLRSSALSVGFPYDTWSDILAYMDAFQIQSDGLTWTGMYNNTQNRSMLSLTSKSSGKYYYEFRVIRKSNAAPLIGITENHGTVLSSYVGSVANSWGYAADGNIYNNGASVTTVTAPVANDVVGIAVDFTAVTGSVKFYLNNVLKYTSTALAASNWYIGTTSNGEPNSVIGALRTYTGLFSYTPPAGYSPWSTP